MRKIPIDAALALSPYNKSVNSLEGGGYAIVEYLSQQCQYVVSVFNSQFIVSEEVSGINPGDLYDIFDKQDPVWIPLTQDIVSLLLEDEDDAFGTPASPIDEKRVSEVLARYRGKL